MLKEHTLTFSYIVTIVFAYSLKSKPVTHREISLSCNTSIRNCPIDRRKPYPTHPLKLCNNILPINKQRRNICFFVFIIEISLANKQLAYRSIPAAVTRNNSNQSHASAENTDECRCIDSKKCEYTDSTTHRSDRLTILILF